MRNLKSDLLYIFYLCTVGGFKFLLAPSFFQKLDIFHIAQLKILEFEHGIVFSVWIMVKELLHSKCSSTFIPWVFMAFLKASVLDGARPLFALSLLRCAAVRSDSPLGLPRHIWQNSGKKLANWSDFLWQLNYTRQKYDFEGKRIVVVTDGKIK